MLDVTPPAALAAIDRGNPPTVIDMAKSAMVAMSDWMRDRATIVDDYAARRANEFIDRARRSFAALEDERDALVRPLNEQVAEINARYKAIHNTDKKRPGSGDKVLNILLGRLQAFMEREEAERVRKAEEIRKAAEAAAQAALEAEQRMTEALIDEAQHGVVDTDFGILEEQSAEAIDAAARKCRELARAERDTKVRIGGGFSKVSTLRTHEVLTVGNWQAAITELGTSPDGTFALPEGVRDAILTCSRAHRKATGDLPAGITATHERSL